MAATGSRIALCASLLLTLLSCTLPASTSAAAAAATATAAKAQVQVQAEAGHVNGKSVAPTMWLASDSESDNALIKRQLPCSPPCPFTPLLCPENHGSSSGSGNIRINFNRSPGQLAIVLICGIAFTLPTHAAFVCVFGGRVKWGRTTKTNPLHNDDVGQEQRKLESCRLGVVSRHIWIMHHLQVHCEPDDDCERKSEKWALLCDLGSGG